MSRRMSVSMTLNAVRHRTKTVTRRHVDTWQNLRPGDRLTLIEKGMGLPKGAKQVVVTEVEIVDVRVEPLREVQRRAEVAKEGVPGLSGDGPNDAEHFMSFWPEGHGYKPTVANAMSVDCRRIEWRYLDEASS